METRKGEDLSDAAALSSLPLPPLPRASGREKFSITMDPSEASLWPLPTPLGQDDLHWYRPLEGVEEVKHRLAAATAELQAASEELRRKEQNMARPAPRAVPPAAGPRAGSDDYFQQQRLGLVAGSGGCRWFRHAQAILYAKLYSRNGSEDRSTATALEVPRFAAVVADHRSSATVLALEMPRFAAVVHEDNSKVAALAAKRPLPQKGRMLQAVMETGPLLQNLLVAGPLPKWRNPPRPQAWTNAMISAPSVPGAQTGTPRSTH